MLSPEAHASEPVHFERATLRTSTHAHSASLFEEFNASAPSSQRELPASSMDPTATPAPDFGRWECLGKGSFLAPKANFIAEDGGFDVVFHFHAGQMAERQMKESGLNAVFVSYGFGIGSGVYADAFANPHRFDQMLSQLVKSIEKKSGRQGLHVRHLALSSWSAGFAAVSRILSVDRYYAMVDTVVLNDSLHAQYVDPAVKTPAQGADHVDPKMIRSFVRFAKDAVARRKTMVITHSAIIPPDYASSSETTQALLKAVEVTASEVEEPSSRGMVLTKRADAGGLHVRGFRGQSPHDHFEHLYLIGEALASFTAPQWKDKERLVYTLAGE